MTSVAKLQNLTTPVEINWSLMNDEKAVFTFECEPEAEEEEEEELCCRDCGGEVGECCCDYGNPELARLRDGDSEEEADQGLSWENMDFGTAENPTCGICGKREDNPYAFDEDGNLVEDVICAKCDSIYVYDEELDSYIQKKQQEEEEYSCDNCGHQFKNEEEWAGCCDEHSCVNCECDCSECAEEEEVRPTHDQLVALGKYKLAKYQIKKHENICEICDVNKGDEGCDCRIIECARCGEKGPKYNHNLGSDGLLRCDDCFDAPCLGYTGCGNKLTTKQEYGMNMCESCINIWKGFEKDGVPFELRSDLGAAIYAERNAAADDDILCADCGDAIPDTENLDKCWTNDGETFWCEGCRESHVEEYIRERDGDDDSDSE